jgi:transposase
VWVFDRGVVTEENLKELRERGAHYLVGTPRSALKNYEAKLWEGSWQKISEQVQVQLVPEQDEVYVLCRSSQRQKKEQAIRRRRLRHLVGDLRDLRRRLRAGQLKQETVIQRQIGRLQERHPQAWRWLELKWQAQELSWDWDREKFQQAVRTEGAYLLRAYWTERDPQKLWDTYMQLSEAEAAFRTLKSEVNIRPIWHWLEHRVEAHVLVAFLGYCLWVCLKKKAERAAPSLTPWQILDQLGRIVLVEVWFELKDGRSMCLPRITQPELVQRLLLGQLNWRLPDQPPPRIYSKDLPNAPPSKVAPE